MNRTKHGLRDLNGPKMDGKYNGRNQCYHYRTETSLEIRAVEGSEKIRSVKVERCKDCGMEVDFTMREVKQEPQIEGIDVEAVSP